MKATTIKIEGDLLDAIEKIKPATASLTGYVKEVLQAELRRRRLRQAADEYSAFLAEQREEREELDEWERADLMASPRKA